MLALSEQLDRRIVVDRRRGLLALVHLVVQRGLLVLAHLFRLLGLALRRGGGRFLLFRPVFHQIEDAHLLARGLLLERAQVFVRRHRLAARAAVRMGLRVLARLILAGRLGIQRDVDIRLAAGGAALLALLRVHGRDLVDIGQLGRRFIALALLLVLVFVFRRTEHLNQRLRRDAARAEQRCDGQDQQNQQRADRGQRPLEHDVQPAGQQAARVARHAGPEQAGQCFHGEIVFVCAGKRMDDAADQHGQHRNTDAAQAHRPFLPRKQQPRQRQQRKRQHIAALADHRADAAVQPDQHNAVDRQDRQQAQQAEHRPDRAPRGAGQHRLGLGRTPRRLPAARCGFCRFRRFFGCGFSCSQCVVTSL